MPGCQSGIETTLRPVNVSWFTQGRSTGDGGQCVQPADDCQLPRLCGAQPPAGTPLGLPGLGAGPGGVQCPGPPPSGRQGGLLCQQTRPPGLGGLSEGGALGERGGGGGGQSGVCQHRPGQTRPHFIWYAMLQAAGWREQILIMYFRPIVR